MTFLIILIKHFLPSWIQGYCSHLQARCSFKEMTKPSGLQMVTAAQMFSLLLTFYEQTRVEQEHDTFLLVTCCYIFTVSLLAFCFSSVGHYVTYFFSPGAAPGPVGQTFKRWQEIFPKPEEKNQEFTLVLVLCSREEWSKDVWVAFLFINIQDSKWAMNSDWHKNHVYTSNRRFTECTFILSLFPFILCSDL